MQKRLSIAKSKEGVRYSSVREDDYLSLAEKGAVPLPSKEQISMLMAAIGRKGGKIGGKRRMETMTAHERQCVARKAAHARWQRKEG